MAKNSLFDINKRIGGDVLNLSGSSEPDLLAQTLGLAPPDVQPRSNIGQTFTSGLNSINEFGVTLDPRIAENQARGAGMLGSSLEGLRGARQDVLGTENEFMASRMNPLVESTLKQRTALHDRQGKTGIAGSEFGRQSTESFDAKAVSNLEQSKAGAIGEFKRLSDSFDQSEGGLLQMQNIIQSTEFAQEMQAAGMSANLLSLLTDIHLTEQGIRNDKSTERGNQTGMAFSLLSALF